MAFTYGIFGRVSLRWVLIVVMVSTVVTPEHTRRHRVHNQDKEFDFTSKNFNQPQSNCIIKMDDMRAPENSEHLIALWWRAPVYLKNPFLLKLSSKFSDKSVKSCHIDY